MRIHPRCVPILATSDATSRSRSIAASCVATRTIQKTHISHFCAPYTMRRTTTARTTRMRPTSTQVAMTKNGTRRPPSSRCSAPRNRTLPVPTHWTFANKKACSEYSETDVLQALGHAFTDASQGLREEVVRGLLPTLRSAREARPAPGRAFITGLLGFDDACKRFEESSHRNAELDMAYAKIEVSSPTLPRPFFRWFDTPSRQNLANFLRSYRRHTVVLKRSAPFSRSRSKERVHLFSHLFYMLVFISWNLLWPF